jgi:anti-sigma factor RsiW
MREDDGMRCDDARTRLLDDQRGALAPADEAELRSHVAGCAACAHEEQADRLLTEALEHRLPQHPASPALKRRLAAAWPAPVTPPPARWRPQVRAWAPLLAAAAIVVVAVPLLVSAPALLGGRAGMGTLVTEAVNDHLRVLGSEHPLEIASGGVHQVKPWFEGRLDFAPVLAFGGDADFRLEGGAVGWFIDRKAATLVFKRRLHAISLFVFRADGLPWSARGTQRIGAVDVYPTTARGFNVLLWRNHDLGYALVSDVDVTELHDLAGKIIGRP